MCTKKRDYRCTNVTGHVHLTTNTFPLFIRRNSRRPLHHPTSCPFSNHRDTSNLFHRSFTRLTNQREVTSLHLAYYVVSLTATSREILEVQTVSFAELREARNVFVRLGTSALEPPSKSKPAAASTRLDFHFEFSKFRARLLKISIFQLRYNLQRLIAGLRIFVHSWKNFKVQKCIKDKRHGETLEI